MQSSEYEGKVIVVTGGSRGIGKAIVLEAVARGARVSFCARQLGESANQVLSEAEALAGPGRVIAVQADVSSEANVEALFDRTIAAFGRADVVVNNAGFYTQGSLSANTLMVQMPTSEWDAVMATNLTGAFLVSRRAVRQFLGQGTGGAIISIGSVSQDGGTGLVGYAVSKAGLQGLADSITSEYGDRGIRAHVIVVGLIRTYLNREVPDKYFQVLVDWGPQRRAGRLEEIAAITLFLASSRSALWNGLPVYASGGARDFPAYLVQVK